LEIWVPDELPGADGRPEGEIVIEGLNVEVIVDVAPEFVRVAVIVEMRFVDDKAVEEGWEDEVVVEASKTLVTRESCATILMVGENGDWYET
jgi:hypothetical protein